GCERKCYPGQLGEIGFPKDRWRVESDEDAATAGKLTRLWRGWLRLIDGMNQLKVIIAVIVVAGAAAVLWRQHSVNERWQRDNEALRGTVAELKSIRDIR